MKKIYALFFTTLLLCASQYAVLKDGTVVLLKEDGTWEKVDRLSPSSAETAGTPSAENSDPLAEAYARRLLGVWESADGTLKYVFKPEKAVFREGRKRRVGSWKVEKIDPVTRSFRLDLAEADRVGRWSFGGVVRKMAFDEGFTKLTDFSATYPTELSKKK